MRQQGEASVEEILDSIKKVIARDNREGAIEERRRRSSAGVTAMPENNSEPVNAEEADEVFDLSHAELVEDEETAAHGDTPDDDDEDGPLTGEAMRETIRDNFAALSMLARPGTAPQIVRSGETSLEGLVREMLRPMLSEWLDRNLPGMVERMVQAEIARIAGKRD